MPAAQYAKQYYSAYVESQNIQCDQSKYALNVVSSSLFDRSMKPKKK